MPELFLELFSEEIPARMQARAAEDLAQRIQNGFLHEVVLPDSRPSVFYGPRRIAYCNQVAASTRGVVIFGPRIGAPAQAVEGFLRKNGASKEQLREQDGKWIIEGPPIAAATLIKISIPPCCEAFLGKSDALGRYEQFHLGTAATSHCCLLDGEVIPFELRQGDDDGHGLKASCWTEGHRFLAPGAVAVTGAEDWAAKLRDRRVLVDVAERKRLITEGVARLAAERQVTVVDDPGLLDEVAAWWNGRCRCSPHRPRFMDLPAEVMQVSMRVNQRYFALRIPTAPPRPTSPSSPISSRGWRRRQHRRQ